MTAWQGVKGIAASGELLLHFKSAPDNFVKKKKKEAKSQDFIKVFWFANV